MGQAIVSDDFVDLLHQLADRLDTLERSQIQGDVPIGGVVPFAGIAANVPYGWLPCDGLPYSRVQYSSLFLAIGTLWGPGDGSTTFNVPPAEGRTIIASGVEDGDGTAGTTASPLVAGTAAAAGHSNITYAPGDYGGENTHLLSVAEMPAHAHPFAVTQAYSGGGNVSKQGNGFAADWLIGSRTDENVGGSGSHENRMAWMAMLHVIRAL